MRGVDDDEPTPPLKRPRTSSSELVQLSNGSSLIEPVSGSWRDLMSRGEDEDMVGSSGVIKRREFVRIIANALYSLGYKKSGALLEEESGIPLHSSVVNLFIQQILDGNWDESVVTLCKIDMLDENIVKEACLLIFEQKLFEHLDNDNVMEALKTLRIEIAPLCVNKNKVRELSVSVLYPSNVVGGSNCGPRLKAKTRSALLEELQALLPANIMIPEKRLEHLIEQAFRLQRDACRFHNSLDREMSLYTDHHCGRDQIPSQTLQILEAHNDEVWFLRFSHNGKYLASSSNDKSAIIWEVEKKGAVLKHKLVGHEKAISSVSWSPDDRELLSCGEEEAIRRWDVSSGECVGVYEKTGLGMVSCGWSPDGKLVFSGVNDRSICTWDVDGKETECWKGQRTLKISDLEVTGDGRRIISMGKDNAILLFDRETKAERVIEEEHTITSFSLSGDSKFLLVSLLTQELHLWNIDGDAFLVTKFRGHKRSRFVIKSCFGGLKQAFVASGSEDSQVYIWHRGSGELIEALPGHSGAVNCVSWNPVDPHMLASGSDDRTVRIWGLNGLDFGVKCNGSSSSSNNRCNGKS